MSFGLLQSIDEIRLLIVQHFQLVFETFHILLGTFDLISNLLVWLLVLLKLLFHRYKLIHELSLGLDACLEVRNSVQTFLDFVDQGYQPSTLSHDLDYVAKIVQLLLILPLYGQIHFIFTNDFLILASKLFNLSINSKYLLFKVCNLLLFHRSNRLQFIENILDA